MSQIVSLSACFILFLLFPSIIILVMTEDEMLEEIKSNYPSSALELISILQFSPFAQTSLANVVEDGGKKLEEIKPDVA